MSFSGGCCYDSARPCIGWGSGEKGGGTDGEKEIGGGGFSSHDMVLGSTSRCTTSAGR